MIMFDYDYLIMIIFVITQVIKCDFGAILQS